MGIGSIIAKIGGKALGKLSPVTTIIDMIPSQSQKVPIKGEYLTGTRKILGNIGSFVKNELVVNPVQRFKKGLAVAGLGLGAYTGAKYAQTGNLDIPSSRQVAGAVSLAVNPVGAIAGFGTSGISDAYKIAKDNFYNMADKFKAPQLPPVPKIANLPEYESYIPNTSTSLNFNPASSPINLTLPSSSFAPTMNAGGGIGEILPLLLLLGGGAALGGYAVGRRKRKKKKKSKKVKN